MTKTSPRLNANAKEWQPFAAGPEPFALPASTGSGDNVTATEDSPVYYPSFARVGASTTAGNTAGGAPVELEGVNWAEEFERVMALTRELIERQISGDTDSLKMGDATHSSNGVQTPGTSAELPPSRKSLSAAAPLVESSRYPALPGSDEMRPLVSTGKWVNAPAVLVQKAAANGKSVARTKAVSASATGVTSHFTVAEEFDEHGRPLPPLTSKGNRRWKKPTKAQQKRELAQKNAFEAFANALLHSVSPFMAPLRERCKTSLPHIKVDQRFGKSGQPQTAVAQFVVAPLVANYRPRHFHDLTPGDLMEFHYDFAQVLKQLKSATDILIGYGPVWKRYAVPYCYVNCKEYRQEVLSLCPDEVPNMRSEAVYEDDVLKDITEVVLAVDGLEPLQSMSIIHAMSRRVNLAPLFDAFDMIFNAIENYRIIIRDIHNAPSTFLIHTSNKEIDQKPSPLVLYNDPDLWSSLPVVARIRIEETSTAGLSHKHTPETTGSSFSNRPNKDDIGHTTAKNGYLTAANCPNRRGKNTNRKETYSLAVVLPMVGSVLCLVVTAGILWRRKFKR